MKQVGLYEAKTKLSSLVAEVENSGKKIQLTRHGKVVAELCPPAQTATPKRGLLKSETFAIAEDFDEAEVGFEDFFQKEEVSYHDFLDSPSSYVAEDEKPYNS